jgi:hypothetical protein
MRDYHIVQCQRTPRLLHWLALRISCCPFRIALPIAESGGAGANSTGLSMLWSDLSTLLNFLFLFTKFVAIHEKSNKGHWHYVRMQCSTVLRMKMTVMTTVGNV